ncbi:MAG: hypothetical protein A2157_05805 [Deltaproteobacteria bacterium RBG_16_47_11]|nr:MAG: hypothetical protein A2157_05805 [Deltaproteobacteria bacterium RBG_16_47_11]
MHTDESKRFDKRNITNNLRREIIRLKEYETYLAKLPNVSDKIFNPDEEAREGGEDLISGGNHEVTSKKKGGKKKGKG